MIYGTQRDAGKFGRRSGDATGLDWPALEEIVSLGARIEQWFGGGEPKSAPKKPIPKPRQPPHPSEPDEEEPIFRGGLPADDLPPVRIIIGPQPKIIIDLHESEITLEGSEEEREQRRAREN